MNDSPIWVTGARGFIGRYLARQLADRGARVGGLGHGLWDELDARAWGVRTWLNGEIQNGNLQTLTRLTSTPQIIFHLAGGASVASAVAQPREDFSRNVVSTVDLLEWVRINAPGSRVILVSSAAIYGTGRDGPLSESMPAAPCSPYGFHKLMMEQLCESYRQSYGVNVTVVRLFSVYGPWLKKQLLWELCSRLLNPEGTVWLGGSGDEVRDWADVRDVANALTFLGTVRTEPRQVINVATGIGTAVCRIAQLVLENWDQPRAVEFSGVSRAGDPSSMVADNTLLAGLGFKWTISLEQGIKDYVTWFLKESRRA